MPVNPPFRIPLWLASKGVCEQWCPRPAHRTLPQLLKKKGFRSRDWVLRHSGFLTKAEGDLPDRVLEELGFTNMVERPLAIYL